LDCGVLDSRILAILVLSYMAEAIASLAFEARMMALNKVIFQSRNKKQDRRKS
ncbi:hypothetical protein BaRGS_00007242, partial [Batillaria attramentaria]